MKHLCHWCPRWLRIMLLASLSVIVALLLLVGAGWWYFHPSVDRSNGIVYGRRDDQPLGKKRGVVRFRWSTRQHRQATAGKKRGVVRFRWSHFDQTININEEYDFGEVEYGALIGHPE